MVAGSVFKILQVVRHRLQTRPQWQFQQEIVLLDHQSKQTQYSSGVCSRMSLVVGSS